MIEFISEIWNCNDYIIFIFYLYLKRKPASGNLSHYVSFLSHPL